MSSTVKLVLTKDGYELGNQLLGYTKIDSNEAANILKKDSIKLYINSEIQIGSPMIAIDEVGVWTIITNRIGQYKHDINKPYYTGISVSNTMNIKLLNIKLLNMTNTETLNGLLIYSMILSEIYNILVDIHYNIEFSRMNITTSGYRPSITRNECIELWCSPIEYISKRLHQGFVVFRLALVSRDNNAYEVQEDYCGTNKIDIAMGSVKRRIERLIKEYGE